MLDEIAIFIQDTYTPEQRTLIRDAFSLFDEYELADYQNDFVAILMDSDGADPDAFLDLVQQDLTMITTSHEIVLSDDASLENYVEVVRALSQIADYEDSDAVVRYISADGDNEERFATLLTLVSTYTTEQFMLCLDSVSTSLFSVILEKHMEGANNSNNDYSVDLELHNTINHTLYQLKKVGDYAECFGFILMRRGFPVGCLFEHYVSQVKHLLQDGDKVSLSREIFVLLKMSRDGFASPKEVFQKWASLFYDDLTKITDIDIMLTKRIVDFDRLTAQGELG